jgi:hypothetical protein
LQVLDPGQSLEVTGAFPTRAGDLVLGHQITVCREAKFRSTQELIAVDQVMDSDGRRRGV